MGNMHISEAQSAALSPFEHARTWLQNFESALASYDRGLLTSMFSNDCHWRDLLAFTWTIKPSLGREAIIDQLLSCQIRVGAKGFNVAPGRTPPRRVQRLGVEVIEAIFEFETSTGRANGTIRLLSDNPQHAWVFMTSLNELKGYEEPINARRPSGADYAREFGGDNWADRRKKEQAFEGREPAVLIIGAGQSGLSLAARLRLLGVDALCVDKVARVGDQWRNRYHSLALHNQVALNHMAYMPFPPSWPKYLPKDMLANWIEQYAVSMECNVWTGTSFLSGAYDSVSQTWKATVERADGTQRILRPRHLVFANGIVGSPKMPNVPGLQDFRGTLVHTHGYTDGSAWKGKRAIVLGAGTSGHDIAQDLYGHGAEVKLVQRGSITVVSVEAATLAYTLYYKEGLPTEDCDLIALSNTFQLTQRGAQVLAKKMQDVDRELLSGLEAKGFKIDLGEDGGGYQTRVRRTHSGYYLNCGCSELIAEGKIGLLQSEDIVEFVPEGALMNDGRIEKADLVVAATGYQSQQEAISDLLGADIAQRVGPIWGLDKDSELSNMYKPTAQPGLWFVGSGLSQARIYSHYVALQIKAREIGIV
jgi:cation diffusion facilitator CzcD-associated flavoprotein CzcO